MCNRRHGAAEGRLGAVVNGGRAAALIGISIRSLKNRKWGRHWSAWWRHGVLHGIGLLHMNPRGRSVPVVFQPRMKRCEAVFPISAPL